MNCLDSEIHEECGVFGIYGIERIKGEGLVTEIFNEGNLSTLKGSMAIGHVRYSTTGGGGIDNVQPFLFHHNTGDFSIAHNGNIVNSQQLRRYLEDRGTLFQSSSDSEILAHLIRKDPRERKRPRILAIKEALNMIEGAFAFLIMTENRIYACRDKHGLRPLSLGKLGDGYVVSSETCAFDVIGAQFIRDIEPGEIVTIDHQGIRSNNYSTFQHHFLCAMEYIYFARPDSDIEGCNVHSFRKVTGKLLFEEAPAEASGLPYEMGLIKNKYIGRTFIQPSQEMRDKGVKMKLSPVKTIVNGKRIVLVDDSVVRGTTSRRIVTMLREAGATEVHLRIASPQITGPCYYGIDITTRKELMCAGRSLEEVRQSLGVDSIAFLSEKALFEAGRREELCLACFNGNYPTYLYRDDSEETDTKC